MSPPALEIGRVSLPRPASRFTLLVAPDGRYLAVGADGTLGLSDQGDDSIVWAADGAGWRHVSSGLELAGRAQAGGGVRLALDGHGLGADGQPSNHAARFVPARGPAELPSQSLAYFKAHGWACLVEILDPEVVDGLQWVAGTDRWAERTADVGTSTLVQHAAVAHATVEPVSLWLMRQYMATPHIRLGHTPSLAVLPPDDGQRDVQGWHSDFPYLWGGTDRVPIGPSSDLVLGIQRNYCVSDFTLENGATVFKLGSHALNQGPPGEWGVNRSYGRRGYRAEHGLPYEGPEAAAVEAPAGSILIYDARTWHRAGVNRTPHKRGAILNAVTPMFIIPFMDTSRRYQDFLASAPYAELDARERHEMERLMVHEIVGPEGRFAIKIDAELTEVVREARTSGAR